MESMRRQLSTSLPRQRDEPDLLSEFKAAALSVTNLYKTAATSQKRARTAGYQDALEELLAFLDKENLGVSDGEGWRVRQWATERLDLDGVLPRRMSTDDEDASNTSKEEERTDDNNPNPGIQRKSPAEVKSNGDVTGNGETRQRRVASEPPQQQNSTSTHSEEPAMHGNFTFRSNRPYPSAANKDMAISNMDLDKPNNPATIFTSVPTISPPETVRILPRAVRSSRVPPHNRRNDNRGAALNVNLGVGAGNKRKLPYPDFFDISGVHDGTDRKDINGPGWGKRGRHA